MVLIDGKATANQIKNEIAEEVKAIKSKGERAPHLAAVLIGNDGASLTYVGSKVRSCEKVGFDSSLIRLPEETTEAELLAKIAELNQDDTLDGYIVHPHLPAVAASYPGKGCPIHGHTTKDSGSGKS